MADLDLSSATLLKAYLKITGSGDDTLLATLVTYATKVIQRYCDRNFDGAVARTEYYDGNGGNILFLKNFPVITITSIDHWDTYNDSSLQTFVVNTDYLLYAEEGYIYLRQGWQEGHRNYKLVYTAGYANQAAVPDDLELACNMLAAYYYANPDKAGIKSEGIGNYSVTYLTESDDIPATIKMLLKPYRKLSG